MSILSQPATTNSQCQNFYREIMAGPSPAGTPREWTFLIKTLAGCLNKHFITQEEFNKAYDHITGPN